MREPVIDRDLSTFPSSQIWDVLPANPGLVSSSGQIQGYGPAPSAPAGSAPELMRMCISSNSALFSDTSRNYSKHDAEILPLQLVTDFLQVQKAPGYPAHYSPELFLVASLTPFSLDTKNQSILIWVGLKHCQIVTAAFYTPLYRCQIDIYPYTRRYGKLILFLFLRLSLWYLGQFAGSESLYNRAWWGAEWVPQLSCSQTNQTQLGAFSG